MKHDFSEGSIFKTNSGDCCVIKYENARRILVRFSCGYERWCTSPNLLKGVVKNLYFPTTFGVGFIGENFIDRDEKLSEKTSYKMWRGVLRRCYDDEYREIYETYKDVSIDQTWLNYSNFSDWCNSKYEFNQKDDKGEKFHIDKDFVKGSRVYSPQTCIIIPRELNQVIVNRKNSRGDLPLGVIRTKGGKFCSQILINGKRQNGLTYNNIRDAFEDYKRKKEDHIKNLVLKYDNKLSDEVKNIILKYKVDIND